jgi:hypothetical protein
MRLPQYTGIEPEIRMGAAEGALTRSSAQRNVSALTWIVPHKRRGPHVLAVLPHKGFTVLDARALTSFFGAWTTAFQAHIPVSLHQVFGGELDHARNLAVKFFLKETDATHLFFLDDDVLLPPDAIVRLLQHNLPVVSGLYYERGPPHRPIIMDYPKIASGKHACLFRCLEDPPRAVTRCDIVPAGCLMIQRRVFRKLKPPWFKTAYRHGQFLYGEDVYFSLRLRRAGFKVYVDTYTDSLHLVSHIAGSLDAIRKWSTIFRYSVHDVKEHGL